MPENPRVGVGVIVTRSDRVLLIRRVGVHGRGTWSTPGGHLEYGESPEACAIRETKEETGVDITNVRAIGYTNDVFEESGRHYITLWMAGEHRSGEATIAAPYEVAEVGWYAWGALPEPLFLPLWNLIRGKSYPPNIDL
jgi:8-oxo-dGTP diphosphatase